MTSPRLSIVIPCYNEYSRLQTSWPHILTYAKRSPSTELVFVNDGSTDQTLSLLQSLKSSHPSFIQIVSYFPNRGKGYAIKQGILHARGQLILLCDADLSTPLTELAKLLPFAKDFDLVIGSRKLPGSQTLVYQSPARKLLGRLYSFVSRKLLHLSVLDLNCGFKLLHSTSARQIMAKTTIDRWGYDAELLTIAAVQGLTVKEVGVVWTNDFASKVNVSSDIFSSLRELLLIFIYSKLGKYA